MNPPCPKCHQPLQKVRRPSNSMLNEDQFDSVRAGDWFCECHNNGRGNTAYAYFWDKELTGAEVAAPLPEPTLTDRQLCLLSLLFNRHSSEIDTNDGFTINKWLESKIAEARNAER